MSRQNELLERIAVALEALVAQRAAEDAELLKTLPAPYVSQPYCWRHGYYVGLQCPQCNSVIPSVKPWGGTADGSTWQPPTGTVTIQYDSQGNAIGVNADDICDAIAKRSSRNHHSTVES